MGVNTKARLHISQSLAPCLCCSHSSRQAWWMNCVSHEHLHGARAGTGVEQRLQMRGSTAADSARVGRGRRGSLAGIHGFGLFASNFYFLLFPLFEGMSIASAIHGYRVADTDTSLESPSSCQTASSTSRKTRYCMLLETTSCLQTLSTRNSAFCPFQKLQTASPVWLSPQIGCFSPWLPGLQRDQASRFTTYTTSDGASSSLQRRPHMQRFARLYKGIHCSEFLNGCQVYRCTMRRDPVLLLLGKGQSTCPSGQHVFGIQPCSSHLH